MFLVYLCIGLMVFLPALAFQAGVIVARRCAS